MFRTKKGSMPLTTWHQKFDLKTSLDLYEVKLPTSDTTSITALIKKSQCVSMVYLQVNFILWQFWKRSFLVGVVFDTALYTRNVSLYSVVVLSHTELWDVSYEKVKGCCWVCLSEQCQLWCALMVEGVKVTSSHQRLLLWQCEVWKGER